MNVTGRNAAKLKRVMQKENLNWRSFVDSGGASRGPIAKKWNLAATPTIYLIDHNGVIRNKWVGGLAEKALDAALEKLIQAVEKKNPPSP